MKTFEEITKDEFISWYNQDITQTIFKYIEQTRQLHVESLAGGSTIGDNTAELTAKLVGNIEGLDFLLNIKFSDFEETGGIEDV